MSSIAKEKQDKPNSCGTSRVINISIVWCIYELYREGMFSGAHQGIIYIRTCVSVNGLQLYI